MRAIATLLLLACLPIPGRAQESAATGGDPAMAGAERDPFFATPGFRELRATYLRAVETAAEIEPGLALVSELREDRRPPAGSGLDALLLAYQGSLTLLRAKHGRWPPARLRHTREGLRMLDEAVSRAPEMAEVRYVRLMSGYYLPSWFGRVSEVEDDFAALARLLPGGPDTVPRPLYRAMVRFVLDNGAPTAAQRAALEAILVPTPPR